MVFSTTILASLALLPLAAHAFTRVQVGQTCNMTRNGLASSTHAFVSDCDPLTFCDPNSNTCQPRGCRSQIFPFGYAQNDTLPSLCPTGQFCPDEADTCLPQLAVGENCQMDRDDECAPAPNADQLSSPWNNGGAICLQFQCFYQNVTEGQACVVDNVVYTGFRSNGSEFANIVSRDNCQTGSGSNLYCDAQSLICTQQLDLGGTCNADKMCISHNCGLGNTCVLAAGVVKPIPIWEYIITGVGIVVFILVIFATLFFIHKRHRAQAQKEIREYYHEQTTYRSSIIALHTAARERTTSMYSQSQSQFSQYDEHGNMIYRDDDDERGLIASAARPGSRLRQSYAADDDDDSDDERQQGRRLLAGASRASFADSRLSLDQDPRGSYDYGQGSGSGYAAVPLRQSVDLPPGASAPKPGGFKDPWSQ